MQSSANPAPAPVQQDSKLFCCHCSVPLALATNMGLNDRQRDVHSSMALPAWYGVGSRTCRDRMLLGQAEAGRLVFKHVVSQCSYHLVMFVSFQPFCWILMVHSISSWQICLLQAVLLPPIALMKFAD